MASLHSVVKLPASRCVVKPLKRGFASSLEELFPASAGVADWAEKTRNALGDDVDPAGGIILELSSVIAVFDRRLDDISGRMALPLADGVKSAGKLEVAELPAAEVIELRYPAKRTVEQVLEDVYEQAIGFSEKSRKRDLGGFLRIIDRRAAKANGGFVVQLETVERVASDD